jgi:hypothetical protein
MPVIPELLGHLCRIEIGALGPTKADVGLCRLPVIWKA